MLYLSVTDFQIQLSDPQYRLDKTIQKIPLIGFYTVQVASLLTHFLAFSHALVHFEKDDSRPPCSRQLSNFDSCRLHGGRDSTARGRDSTERGRDSTAHGRDSNARGRVSRARRVRVSSETRARFSLIIWEAYPSSHPCLSL